MGTTISKMTDAGALAGTERLEVAKLSASVTITANTISAAAADNSYNDSGSGFLSAGFAANMHVHVTGFTGNVANNVASGKILSVTAGKMILVSPDGDVIVDDAAGESVTITAWETYSTDAASLAGAGANVAAQIVAADAKTALVDADSIGVVDSEDGNALKESTLLNLRSYVLGGADALVYKGAIDCSSNPNYPAADAGHVYRVSVAGKIGGGSGPNVEVGDRLTCNTDSTSAGTHASVGANWDITQVNLDGAVIGPASATDGGVARFDGTSGKVLKNGPPVDAGETTYTPATDADWDGSADPGNVDEALDQLAERVADLEGGGGSGTVTSVDASGGVQTASGSAITNTGTIRGANVINAQTGTSYALIATDRGKHVTLSNASSIAVTIAQAGTTGFEDGWFSLVENIGVGAATITPTTSTINGAATLVLTSGMSAIIFSDGTNYRAMVLDAAGVLVNAQTGTSYTFVSGDRGKLVTHSNGSAVADTLPQATGAFGSGWFVWVENRGAGTVTITPTTSTIDGAASLALTTNQGCLIASDGTNYFTMRGIGGSGGGLTNWTEAANSSSPNATVPVVSFTATNAATNVDAAIVPKGTGALLADIPDGASSGGNKRGVNAVDLQTIRSAAAQVASGSYAAIGGGNTNTASGNSATVPGGESNVSSGNYSTVVGGRSNDATGQYSISGGFDCSSSGEAAVTFGVECIGDAAYDVCTGLRSTARGIIGAVSHASGSFTTTAGQSQTRSFILRRATSDATPTVLTTDNTAPGTNDQIILPNNSLFAFEGQLTVREAATGDSKSIEFKGSIKRGANAAATALQGSVAQADLGTPDAGAAAWTVAFTADTTNGGLAITVTGEASHSLRWVARVVTTEVVD